MNTNMAVPIRALFVEIIPQRVMALRRVNAASASRSVMTSSQTTAVAPSRLDDAQNCISSSYRTPGSRLSRTIIELASVAPGSKRKSLYCWRKRWAPPVWQDLAGTVPHGSRVLRLRVAARPASHGRLGSLPATVARKTCGPRRSASSAQSIRVAQDRRRPLSHCSHPCHRLLELGASSRFRDTLAGRKTELWLTPMIEADLAGFGDTDLPHRLLHCGLPPFFLSPEPPERDFPGMDGCLLG